MTDKIEITEVGPRDGLQNESNHLSVTEKTIFVDMLQEAGLPTIELGSFVHPKAVPAMANTDDLVKHYKGASGFKKLALIMNQRGFDRALESGVDGVCIVLVASDTLCEKNNRKTIPEAIQIAQSLMEQAHDHKLFVRIDVGASWVCPYEGKIAPQKVSRIIEQIWEYHPHELALCDTIGQASPDHVSALFELIGNRFGYQRLTGHFHDTNALGLTNAHAALSVGVRRFDASLGGLGGCPFAPGAKGNLATEDLVHLCHAMGFETGIDWEKLWPIVDYMSDKIGRPLGGNSKSWYLAQKNRECAK